MNILKSSYVVIPLITLAVMLSGSYFVAGGMGWYRTINLPSFTPQSWVFSAAWTIIFALTAASVLLVWRRMELSAFFYAIITLFCVNGFLNVLWSYLFFSQHLIGWALIDAVLLEMTTVMLMLLLWSRSKIESLMLAPYAAWGAFAIFLNALIWLKN